MDLHPVLGSAAATTDESVLAAWNVGAKPS
jgi:hypothetical protein